MIKKEVTSSAQAKDCEVVTSISFGQPLIWHMQLLLMRCSLTSSSFRMRLKRFSTLQLLQQICF